MDERPDPADLEALGISEADLAQDQAIAAETYRRVAIKEPRAVSVQFDPQTRTVCFDLGGGAAVTLPLTALGLEMPDGVDISAIFASAQIADGGEYVILPAIEESITVPGTILSALYERAVWRAWSEHWGQRYEDVRSQVMAEFGRKGGKARSPAKAAASRANGAKGGRPRKLPQASGE